MSWLCWKRTQVHVDSLVNPSILWDAQVINCQQYTNQMHIAMFACTHTHIHPDVQQNLQCTDTHGIYQRTGHHFKTAGFSLKVNLFAENMHPPPSPQHTQPTSTIFTVSHLCGCYLQVLFCKHKKTEALSVGSSLCGCKLTLCTSWFQSGCLPHDDSWGSQAWQGWGWTARHILPSQVFLSTSHCWISVHTHSQGHQGMSFMNLGWHTSLPCQQQPQQAWPVSH